MLKKTPIYNLHIELGARMIPFSGYLMPLHYAKGTLSEHFHCRNQAGFFDISHMGIFSIRGDLGIEAFERLIPTPIAGLKVGEMKYTVLTNNDGGIIDDIVVTRMESGLLIVGNAACRKKDYEYLSGHLSGISFFNELTDYALFALQGPAVQSVMQKFSAQASKLTYMSACGTEINGIKCNISRSGYTGEDGFEILVEAIYAKQLARLLLSDDLVEPIGLGASDTLRLEAGLSLYGHEITESISPIEAGLHGLLVKNHKHYPGASKIQAQLQYDPGKIRVGLLSDSKVPVRQGSLILSSEDTAVGYVTSGSFSPSLQRPIAMALIDPYTLDLGYPLYAMVRNHKIEVNLTALPFIPHRYQR